MKSKKDQGNDFFKKEKYQEAISSYTEYVKADHQDNSKAYANMALSLFKLQKYEECITACESAVEIEPEHSKAYYRMYQAYKELKDNYGMLIVGEKFCKISKEEKEIKDLQRYLPKIKEELSYQPRKQANNSQSDKMILQIINDLGEANDVVKIKKQPQICLQSKWLKIQQLVKDNRRLALNQARKFLSQECKNQQEKDKYKKLLPKLNLISKNQETTTKSKQTSEHTESSQEDVKLQELQKYTAQQQKKAKQAQKTTKQNESKSQIPKKEEQILVTKIDTKTQPTQPILNHTQAKYTQQPQPRLQHVKIPEPQGKWEDFVKEDEVQRLYQSHITTKMSKYEDQFIGLYESLSNLLRSTDLDRFQKEAILSVTPTKLKKFNMLMKSYTGKQKQQLVQLFTENNLHTVMQKYHLKK